MANISVADIKTIIRDIVCSVSGKSDFQDVDNLLSRDIGIMPVDFLYVFDCLEKRFGLPLFEIVENRDYTVMTIDNLSHEIAHKLSTQSPF